MMLKMIFEDGFVHADLHPGNIFITPDDKVAILDLGLVGELDELHRGGFARYFAAWAQGDGDAWRAHGTSCRRRAAIRDYAGFEARRDHRVRRPLLRQAPRRSRGRRRCFFDMMNILRRYRVRVNPTFTLVNIAIAVTEGIGKQLDPEVDLMAEALPFFASSTSVGAAPPSA